MKKFLLIFSNADFFRYRIEVHLSLEKAREKEFVWDEGLPSEESLTVVAEIVGEVEEDLNKMSVETREKYIHNLFRKGVLIPVS